MRTADAVRQRHDKYRAIARKLAQETGVEDDEVAWEYLDTKIRQGGAKL